MRVVLTGDVHQWINSADRAYASETECALALEYARIARRHGLKVTLFFTGLAVIEDEANVQALLAEDNVEVGGHGWDSFEPQWRYRAANRLFGSPHGSRAIQARMVRRTCAAIERVTGQKVMSWRNHAYTFDANTPLVLADAGFQVWSDKVDRQRLTPYAHASGVTILPINTTPDHEHLYHGAQTVETIPVARRPGYDYPDAWRERVVRQVQAIVKGGGTATILAHPLCMKVADDWRTFEHLCSRLSSYPTAWAIDTAQPLSDPVKAARTRRTT
ncbi:MAG: polysaccharide deacetylase family protein [Actinomycetota bacterium]